MRIKQDTMKDRMDRAERIRAFDEFIKNQNKTVRCSTDTSPISDANYAKLTPLQLDEIADDQ